MELIDKEKFVEFLDNYSIDRETTVMDLYRDTLQAIQNMEIEAIPIEWLIDYGKKRTINIRDILIIIDDWRKENE